MGIHVSLIGVRALIAPLCGIWLYGLMGWPVWLIAIGFSVGSILMYESMARYERREGIPPHPHDMGS